MKKSKSCPSLLSKSADLMRALERRNRWNRTTERAYKLAELAKINAIIGTCHRARRNFRQARQLFDRRR